MKITSIEINQTRLINWCKKRLNNMINANGILTTHMTTQIWDKYDYNTVDTIKDE